MRTEIVLLIIGMAVVTYIPRALPAVLLEKIKLSGRPEKFLRLIPYTAMSALIFPGILTSGGDTMLPGIAGGLAALLIALFKPSVPLVVAGAVAAAMLTSIFF
ncbi:MAG TPA: AzlD domain-containing protein [Clostridiaceae bacterium]|jgi:branched-subunit amino acid transport protein|nr:AzlD domain-containing protein [Clostridiaceae bacterium]